MQQADHYPGTPARIADHPPAAPTRREFLRDTARKAVYVAPAIIVLAPGTEALANSKDGIAWSQCASFGDPCGAAQCCPGFQCVSDPVPMCQPMA